MPQFRLVVEYNSDTDALSVEGPSDLIQALGLLEFAKDAVKMKQAQEKMKKVQIPSMTVPGPFGVGRVVR